MAKKIEIPVGRPMTEQEYEKLISHLRNSAVWYAMNGRPSTGLIGEKLREKNVPQEAVTVDFVIEGLRDVYLWEDVFKFLEESMLVDDDAYATRLIEREAARGRGRRQISTKLWQKKVPSDVANRLLDEFYEDEENEDVRNEALEKAHRAAMNSSGYRKAITAMEKGERPKMSPRQALTNGMVNKGFNFGEVAKYLDSLEEEEDF